MTPGEILQQIYERASATLSTSVIDDKIIRGRVDYVCRCSSNRAGVRLLMSCLLGKLDSPSVDPRKPYTEIGSEDCFSGRTYDERYLTDFINRHRLPCNQTTAYLTPGLRNIDYPLTTDVQIVGRPRELYTQTLQILDDVHKGRVDAETMFVEVVRVLLNMRDERLKRMNSLLDSLKSGRGALPLSSEAIIKLIEQHLACKNSSRLPVLIVAAAYQAAGERLGERVLPLKPHNAADLQTGSIGDVEVCIVGDDNVVTAYEMKTRRVTMEDVDAAVAKVVKVPDRIHNYIFVTTEKIEVEVAEYAVGFYDDPEGIAIVILDCIGFLRHFLHLFYRLRTDFLEAYQKLVLAEPDSAVSQTLKEAFLSLRQVAETGE
jgi:hypothetical protein